MCATGENVVKDATGWNPFFDSAAGLISGLNNQPSGPAISGTGQTNTSVGGLTINKKPDWFLIVGAIALGGAVVWAINR